jgi:hypothetical protein
VIEYTKAWILGPSQGAAAAFFAVLLESFHRILQRLSDCQGNSSNHLLDTTQQRLYMYRNTLEDQSMMLHSDSRFSRWMTLAGPLGKHIDQ